MARSPGGRCGIIPECQRGVRRSRPSSVAHSGKHHGGEAIDAAVAAPEEGLPSGHGVGQTDLAVGNDVDSGELKVAKREQGRVVLGLLEPGFR
jgi:hypothetical protein